MFQINDVSDYIRLVTDKIQTSGTKMTSAWMMFFFPVFTVCHPDTAKVLFKSSEPKPKYSLGGSYRMLLPWLGNGCSLVCHLISFFIKYHICLNPVPCIVFLCLKVMVYWYRTAKSGRETVGCWLPPSILIFSNHMYRSIMMTQKYSLYANNF